MIAWFWRERGFEGRRWYEALDLGPWTVDHGPFCTEARSATAAPLPKFWRVQRGINDIGIGIGIGMPSPSPSLLAAAGPGLGFNLSFPSLPFRLSACCLSPLCCCPCQAGPAKLRMKIARGAGWRPGCLLAWMGWNEPVPSAIVELLQYFSLVLQPGSN